MYILIAGILWGIISVFVRKLSAIGFSSMQIVAIRVFFSALILTVYLLITDKRKLRIRFADIPLFLGTGLCSIVLFNFCYFEAIEVIGSSAVPALLLYTAPIFVMIMSVIIFHERVTVKKILALAVTFIGLMFVTGALSGGEKISFRVVLLGLGSGLGYALYSIFGKFLVNKYSAVTITTFTFIAAAIFIVPFSGVVNNIRQLVSAAGILSAIGISLISSVIPFVMYTKGLSSMEAGKACILSTIEPFSAAAIGIIVFHESLNLEKIIGMILILFAIVLLNIKNEKKNI